MEISSENSYRANRKGFFLTYSKCGDLTREEVLAHLTTKGDIEKYLIALESHKDGTPHIHAYLMYAKERNFRNSRWADITKGDRTIHPYDGGAVKNEFKVLKYCTKEDDFITNFYQLKVDAYAQAFSMPTFKEAFDHVKSKRPRDIALYGHNIEANMKKHFKKEKKFTPPDIQLRADQLEILELFKEEPKARKIIWIWSHSTGAGKSTFLKHVLSQHAVLLGTDLKNTLYSYDDQDIIWFDVPRQQPLDAGFTSMLEALANQMPQMSTKYVATQKIVVAHIVVTCNRPPPHDKLPDRLQEFDWNSHGMPLFNAA